MKKIKIKKYIPEIIAGEKDFYSSINRAMKTSDHKEALMDIIGKFEKYKVFMVGNIISTDVPSLDIYTFKIIYQLKNKVWREFEIFGDQTLEELAEAVIESMNWDNDHLHAFFFPEMKGKKVITYWYNIYEIGSDDCDNDQYPILHTVEVLVGSIDYNKNPKLGFVFDFGDNHSFIMEYKSTRIATERDIINNFPKLVDQRGVGPEQYPEYFE